MIKKKALLVGAAIVLGSASLLCVLGRGSVRAESRLDFGEFLLGSSIQLQFDGYCEGVELHRIPGTPAFTGSFCGCVTFSVFATFSGSGNDLALHLHPSETETGGVYQMIFRADHTVETYTSAGLATTATWSRGCPTGRSGLPSIFD